MKPSILLGLLLLGAFTALISLYTTSTGIGLAPDSYIYAATAQGLASGHGARIPNGPDAWVHSAHFPPLYAGLLALGSLRGLAPLETARWLNAFLFAITVLLAGLAAIRLSEGSGLAAVLGSVLVLGSGDLILVHAQVWSEPPFFVFALAGLLLLSSYLAKGKTGFLMGAAAAFGLAFLARYAGIALALSGALCLLARSGQAAGGARQVAGGIDAGVESPPRTPRRGNDRQPRRASLVPGILKELAFFLGLSCGPVGLWMIYNELEAGSLTNRTLAVHLVSRRDLLQGARTISGWFFPWLGNGIVYDIFSVLLVLAGLVLLAGLARRALRSPRAYPAVSTQSPDNPWIAWLPFVTFIITYAAFLLVSLSFFDDQTGLDLRILSPILLTSLILIAAGVARLWQRPPRLAGSCAALLLGILLGFHLLSGSKMVDRLHAGENKGYAGVEWTGSKLIEQIRGYPQDTLIYSNGQDVIYLLTGRPAIGIPRMRSPNSLRANERFDEELQAMSDALEAKNGLLVIFSALQERRRYLPAEYDLNELLPLERITRWQKEGTLYRIKSK